MYAYPRDEPFEKEKLSNWLNQVSLKKAKESDLRTTDFKQRQRDPTLYENFLERSIVADR